MKRLALVILAGSVLMLAAARPPDTSADDEAIRQVIADNTAAFNRRDPKGLVAHVADCGDHIGVSGEWIVGREAQEKNLVDYFRSERPTTEDAVARIRYLEPRVAVAIVKRVYRSASGSRNSVATYVMHKARGGWQIEAFQNTFAQ